MAKIKFKDTAAACKRIRTDLKNKKYRPLYLLMGEEAYCIDQISNYIAQNVLTEAERSFDQLILYGKDTNVPQLIDTARRFPMVAGRQVVIVREAQDLKKIELLEAYIKQPPETTMLVLCYKGKTVDKRTSFYKQALKNGEVLETALLYDNELAEWITGYLKEKNCTIDIKAGALLAEHLGADLSKIANELDKLFTVLPEGSKHITAEHIEKNIGISKDYNTFELNSAISKRDVLKANRIIQHFAHNPKDYPIIVTVSTLFMEFSRILKLHFLQRKSGNRVAPGDAAAELGVHPFFVRDYEQAAAKYSLGKTLQVISLLREYDMRSKGFNNGEATHGELLRELVYKILH
ncbi:MAG: DNA polymerase III subunit delta [Prevotellaceae bacterium]|jgi:DNA polymerase-3 subunit delta|nr:DNA polymerase III subunit delta [Prevotellaceae bacterium]